MQSFRSQSKAIESKRTWLVLIRLLCLGLPLRESFFIIITTTVRASANHRLFNLECTLAWTKPAGGLALEAGYIRQAQAVLDRARRPCAASWIPWLLTW